MSKTVNIAIDGPAGAGKSTIAKSVAGKLGYVYIDTGALYRSIALYTIRKNAESKEDITACLDEINLELKFMDGTQKVFLNGEDVSDKIRTAEVSMGASRVSAIPEVRTFLFELQKKNARENNVIMDGRDIGTVVLPDADLKIFLTASAEERANRRYLEMKDKPDCPTYQQILDDIIKRDYDDSHRATAPLKQADDAVLVDSTEMSLEEVIDHIAGLISEKVKK
ncbi:MAG: (d)CMP kinase [Oscillospiraceae bacterium]